MRKYFLLMIFFSAIFLTGCKEKNNYNIEISNFESFYNVDSTFIVDDVSYRYKITFKEKEDFIISDFLITFELHFKVHKKDGSIIYHEALVTELERTFYENIIMEDSVYKVELFYFYLTDSKGKISSKNQIQINEKKYVHLDKISKGESLVKEDEIFENEERLLELNNKLVFYDINKENHLRITQWNYTTLKIDGKTIDNSFSAYSVDFQAEPFYLHTNVSSVNSIIQETENGFVSAVYDLGDEKHENKYIITPFYVESTENPTEMIEDYIIDASKMKIEIKENVYIVSAFIKDIIDEETYNMLVDLYESLGLDTSIIDKTIIKVIYTFVDRSLSIETSITIQIENVETIIRNITTIKFESFEVINIFDEEKFILKPPTNISSSIPFSKLDVNYETEFNTLFSPHFYKFELTKGQYEIKIASDYDYLKFKIYDKNYQEIDANIFKETNSFNNDINMTFIIALEDVYYISLEKTITSGGYEFMISKLDYETFFNKNQMQKLKSGVYDLSFEGIKDIIGYSAEYPKNSVLKIGKLSKENFNSLKVGYYKDGIMEINDISTYNDIYIPLARNRNFYFFDDEYSEGNNYQIEIEIITSNIYFNDNYESMLSLTEEYTSIPIIMGESMEKNFLKFSVKETGKFKFLFQELNSFGTSIDLYTKEGNYIGNFGEHNIIELEVGEYYVECHYEYLLYIFSLAIQKIE